MMFFNINVQTIDALMEPDNRIFVFGSNLAGRHGKGAAKAALKWGALYGKGEGYFGRTYAIPTKDENLGVLPVVDIQKSVERFLEFARNNPELELVVTPIGTGLAGYFPSEIAPLFTEAPENVYLPLEFVGLL